MSAVLDAWTNPPERQTDVDIGSQGASLYLQGGGSFEGPIFVEDNEDGEDHTVFALHPGVIGQAHQLPGGFALTLDAKHLNDIGAYLNSTMSMRVPLAETFLPLSSVVGYVASTPWQNIFNNVVANWRKHLTDRHYKGILARLAFLFDDEVEISERQKAPDVDSFSALIAYISANPDFKTPSVSYNRDGYFEATWVGDKKLRLAVSFIGLRMVRWLYLDARSGIENATTGAGTVPTLMLAHILHSYQTLEWMRG